MISRSSAIVMSSLLEISFSQHKLATFLSSVLVKLVTCISPKVIDMIFEGLPDCIHDERRWFHPDMIIGECFLLIPLGTPIFINQPRDFLAITRKAVDCLDTGESF